MSVLIMVLVGSMVESLIDDVKALTENVKAFLFGKTHNYRNGWRP